MATGGCMAMATGGRMAMTTGGRIVTFECLYVELEDYLTSLIQYAIA